MDAFYPVAISVPVTDLAAARHFLVEAMGIALIDSGEGWALLDNGSIALRLRQTSEPAAVPVQLELTTRRLAQAAAELAERPEVGSRSEERWPVPERCEIHFDVQDWLRLVLFRTYDEDELGVTPELPMSLPWSSEAAESMRALLRSVPVPFRDRARLRSTQQAEKHMTDRKLQEVSLSIAIEGLADVTPDFQHGSLRAALIALEIPEAVWSGLLRDTEGRKQAVAASDLPGPGPNGLPDKTCEIDSLVTHARFVKAVLAGRKTQQRRDGLYAYPGESFELEGKAFVVTSVERQMLGNIDTEDARREGFPNLDAYRQLIMSMHRGMPWDAEALVWVHTFASADAISSD